MDNKQIQISFEDFQKVDIRVGRIVEIVEFPEARNPSFKMKIDFGGDIGIKKSCAQLPHAYSKEELLGTLVLAVVNFPPRQIGPAISEVLTLGVPNENGKAIIIRPEREVPLGGKLY